MINITYVGDTLIARKVTGDENVPAGEITFQADLSPPRTEPRALKDYANANVKQPLSNIILSDKASKKWNTKELPRFVGLGQVAERNYVNSQWLDGQLVFINQDYFSFSWMPLNYQILFGRPSYDLTMKMLGEKKSQTRTTGGLLEDEDTEECSLLPTADDDYEALSQHVSNCFDVTHQLEEECYIQDDSSSCIFYDDNSDSCCFE